jgi:hypothetical protein
MPFNVQTLRINVRPDKVWNFLKSSENWSAILDADTVRELPAQSGKPSQVNVQKSVLGRTINALIESDVSDNEQRIRFKYGDGTMEVSVKPAVDNTNSADIVLSYESPAYSASLLASDLGALKKRVEKTFKQRLANQ